MTSYDIFHFCDIYSALGCFTFLGDSLGVPWMHTAGCRGYGAGGRRGGAGYGAGLVQGMVQGMVQGGCRGGAGVGAGGLGAPLSS